MSREALKENKELKPLVQKMERNTKGLVKVVSAMEWVVQQDGCAADLAEFDRAIFDLVQQRRNLRVAFEETLKRVREKQ